MKLKNKTIRIVAIIIILISYLILGYIIIKQQNKIAILQQEDATKDEVQINPELVADRKYGEDILIKNIKLEKIDEIDGEVQEQFRMELKNISDKKTENKWINIKFFNDENQELAVIPSRIYELQPGETTSIAVACSKDLKQAKNFVFEETEPPENYVETNE